MKLDPSNVGALLRRKLDYQWPDQRAEVYVSDDVDGATFEHVGSWFLAGSNTCVFAQTPKETSTATNVPQTSNRRFREDEFLLPRRVTSGRSSIRVQVVYTPTALPLTPTTELAAGAWSELRYTMYSYVKPQ
jgi:hypothetical protein